MNSRTRPPNSSHAPHRDPGGPNHGSEVRNVRYQCSDRTTILDLGNGRRRWMGRSKRQRQRVRFELESVAAKSLRGLLTRTLTAEFGCNRVEAQALAIRALEWLPALGAAAVPGQTRMSVPATRSKRHARSQRREVLVTAVEVGEDTAVWEAFGLAALQRRRLLRWLDEIGRQGGWASLAELAAWADLTPTALGARLAPVRRLVPDLPCGEARSGVKIGRGRPLTSYVLGRLRPEASRTLGAALWA